MNINGSNINNSTISGKGGKILFYSLTGSKCGFLQTASFGRHMFNITLKIIILFNVVRVFALYNFHYICKNQNENPLITIIHIQREVGNKPTIKVILCQTPIKLNLHRLRIPYHKPVIQVLCIYTTLHMFVNSYSVVCLTMYMWHFHMQEYDLI